MKKLVLFLLTGYQTIVSPMIHQLLGQSTLCRYEKQCSVYAKEVIAEYGVLKGSVMALNRLLHCSPLVKPYANI